MLLRLANGETVTAAAKAEKVSRSHVYTVLGDPAAQREMQQIRARYQRLIVGKLVRASSRAVDVLVELQKADSDQIRLAAARSTLTLASEWIGRVEHEIRLTDLEAERVRRERSNGRHA